MRLRALGVVMDIPSLKAKAGKQAALFILLICSFV